MRKLAIWTNFHGHCNFCDGKFEPKDYISRAIEKGLPSYGFSSHAPLPFPCRWSMPTDSLTTYLRNIDDLKHTFAESIQIYKGLEMDYVPGVVSPNSFNKKGLGLDYIIGSIHFCGQFADGTYWEIDGSYEHFLKGLQEIYDGDIKSVVSKYFALTREMATSSKPDIIGHLDKIKIQNKEGKHFSEFHKHYQEEVCNTLETIKSAGSMIEVNTRGIYKRIIHQPYPSRWILEKIKDMNIPIVLNSDAHHPEEITNTFEETAHMLNSIGFKHLNVLFDDRWQSVAFDSGGLKLPILTKALRGRLHY